MADKKTEMFGVPKKKLTGQLVKGGYFAGGVVAGVVAMKMIDKGITVANPTVKGLTGFEMSENNKKWAKPLLVAVGAIAGVVYGIKNENENITALSLGALTVAADGAVKASGYSNGVLSGFGEVGEQVFPALNLPALEMGAYNPESPAIEAEEVPHESYRLAGTFVLPNRHFEVAE